MSESALGAAVLDLTGDTDTLTASMEDARQIVEEHLGGLSGIVDEKMLLLVGGIAALAGGAIAAVKIGMDALMGWSEQVKTLNETLGLSGEQASVFATAMNTVGISVEEGAGGINTFIRNLDASRNAATQALAQYRAAAADLLDQHNETLDTMLTDWLQNQQDAADKTKEIQDNLAESVVKINDNLGKRLTEMERNRNKEIANFAKEQMQIESQAAKASEQVTAERTKSLATLTKDTNKKIKTAKTAEDRAQILEDAADRKKEILAQAQERLQQIEEQRKQREDDLRDKKQAAKEEYDYRVQLEKAAAEEQVKAAEKAADKQTAAIEKALDKQEKAYEARQKKEDDRYAKQEAKLTKTFEKATESANPMEKALKRLGVNAFDAHGNIRPINDLLPQIMDAFAKFPKGPEASAIAMQLFGRSGTKFMEFLRLGSAGLKSAQKDAESFGLVVSEDSAEAAEQFGFALNKLGLAATGLKMAIGKEVFPVIATLLGNLTKWLTENLPSIQAGIKQFLDWLIPKLQMVGDAIKTGDWSKISDQFLGWLNGENGVMKRLPGELYKLGKMLSGWTEGAEGKKRFRSIGSSVAEGVLSGARGTFENKDLVGDVLGGLFRTGLELIASGPKMIGDMGGSFARGIMDGLYKWITGEEASKEIGDAFEQAIRGGIGLATASLNPATLFSFLFTGGANMSFSQRALGGPVSAYQPVVVGERRPEIFMPSVSGRVYPDAQSAGRTTYAYVNVYGDDEARLERAMRRVLYRETGRR